MGKIKDDQKLIGKGFCLCGFAMKGVKVSLAGSIE